MCVAQNKYLTYFVPERPENALKFWICDGFFAEENRKDKMLDHCHYSWRFLGFAHNESNLKIRTLKFIPVVAHHLFNYDLRHFCKELRRFVEECKFDVFPSIDEKYSSLSMSIPIQTYQDKNGVKKTVSEYPRLVNSLRLMTASCDKLS